MKKIIFIVSIIILILLAWILSRSYVLSGRAIPLEAKTSVVVETAPRFSHRQVVWMYALEWCESNGVFDAVNPEDNDGTPSYYSFQFKPGTFRGFGEQYGVIPKGKTDAEIMELMKQYDLQKAILEYMMEDPTIKWNKQFPGCIKKLGWPPKS